MSAAAPPLGQALIARGIIGDDQLRIALREQARDSQPLGRLLVGLGFVDEATLRDALGCALGRNAIDLAHVAIDPAALRRVPRDFAIRHHMLPLAHDETERRFSVACAHPDDIVALDRLRSLLAPGTHVEALLAGEAEIARGIDQHYGHALSIDGILHELETGEAEQPATPGSADEYSQPMVRLVDALLADAVKREASDIHFEPEAGFLRIRYRIDGLLRQIRALHKSCWTAMAVRLKVMGGMNIAETRAPQDGRFSMHIGGRAVDFRCAIQPTLHGENIVLRILDRGKGIVPLDHLGLDEDQKEILLHLLTRPEGIILVTGPTGSGKTTTLYSLLNHINDERINIMTLEDPVEYPLALIRQTAVAEAGRLDFANGIRSMMRQDPDVILVGEIRDADTATMAFRAAMTGHQVFSTLHANSAPGALPRLLEIGVPADILAGNIVGIVAQRLIRRLCVHCRAPAPPDARARESFAALGQAVPETLHRAAGCPRCEQRGYRGRLALMEILRMNEELEELVARRATLRELRAAARRGGFRTLAEDGLRRVAAGVTTLEEVARVADLGKRVLPAA